MNYSIAVLEECCKDDPLKLDISKSGNKYTVTLARPTETGEHEYATQTFDSLMDAYKVFEKLSSWIIFSLYSYENKKSYLLTGTMP